MSCLVSRTFLMLSKKQVNETLQILPVLIHKPLEANKLIYTFFEWQFYPFRWQKQINNNEKKSLNILQNFWKCCIESKPSPESCLGYTALKYKSLSSIHILDAVYLQQNEKQSQRILIRLIYLVSQSILHCLLY
jgi:hypothetical protein